MMNEYTKQQRQQILKHIISEKEIGDQHQLQEELKIHGIEATQATISRDLQEIGVIKTRLKSNVFKYQITEKVPYEVIRKKLKVLFDNFVIEIKSTTNLILLKTTPGNANGVASFVDRLEQKEILGTVAGDDTILVVVDSPENMKKVEQEFLHLFESPNEESPPES